MLRFFERLLSTTFLACSGGTTVLSGGSFEDSHDIKVVLVNQNLFLMEVVSDSFFLFSDLFGALIDSLQNYLHEVGLTSS